MRTAVSDTLMFWPLFVLIDLPTKESKACALCSVEVRESITQSGGRVLINSQARPVQLKEQDGHRYGKFPMNQVHRHETSEVNQ